MSDSPQDSPQSPEAPAPSSQSPKAPVPSSQSSEADDIRAPQGPGAGVTFLYYFVGTALVSALLARQIMHVPFASGIPNQLGSAMGLFGGLIGTYFNANKTLEIPMRGKKALMKRLTPMLTDMGYSPFDRPDLQNTDVFARDGWSGRFSGKIYITFMGKTALISSRAVHIRELSKRVKG
ncbi:MAG: hypothetical protein AAFZ80_13685 [Cyanobacteria bacterium P01_A01_bin.105]